jgi:hypothetical protein
MERSAVFYCHRIHFDDRGGVGVVAHSGKPHAEAENAVGVALS